TTLERLAEEVAKLGGRREEDVHARIDDGRPGSVRVFYHLNRPPSQPLERRRRCRHAGHTLDNLTFLPLTYQRASRKRYGFSGISFGILFDPDRSAALCWSCHCSPG